MRITLCFRGEDGEPERRPVDLAVLPRAGELLCLDGKTFRVDNLIHTMPAVELRLVELSRLADGFPSPTP